MKSGSDIGVRVASRRIAKPALLSTLAKVRLGSVVSLTAPAGYGKSALLQAWQEHADLRTIGVRLGPEHNDENALGLHLLDALGGLVPSGRDLLEGRPGAPDWGRTLLRSLSQTYLILMLDDVHHLTEQTSLRLLKQLVQHTPRRMVLAVSGRSHPFVGLARARVEGRLLALAGDDLALTRSELAILRRQQLGDDQIDEVYRASGGWPAALPWAVAQATGDAEARRERVALDRFLDEEVWHGLEPTLIDHLADAALLSPVTFDTLDAARASGDSLQLAKRLTDHPIPLVTVSEGGLVTIHPLVQASLQAHRSASDPAAQSGLIRRAAEHLSRNDRDDEAFRLWLAANDREALIDFLYTAGRRAALQGRTELVRRWMAAFTPDEFIREIRLQAVSAAVDAAEGNLDAAARWVRRLQALELSDDVHAAELSTVLAEMLDIEGGSGSSVEVDGWWGIVAQLMGGLGVMNEGRLEQAMVQLQSLAPLCVDLPLIDAWRLHTIGYVLVRLDRDDESRACVRRASELLEGSGLRGHPTALVLDALEALLAARMGERREAIDYLDAAQRKLPYVVHSVPARALLPTVVMGEAAYLLGLEQRAVRILDALPIDALPGSPGGFLRSEYDRLSESVRAARGDHELQVTAVQQRILRALASHKTVPAIAREMDRSPATIRTHIRALYATLGAHSRAEAVERARSLRLLDDPSGRPLSPE